MNELQASSVPLVDKCSSQAVILPAAKSPNKVSDSAATTAPNAVLYTSGNMSLSTFSTGSNPHPNPKFCNVLRQWLQFFKCLCPAHHLLIAYDTSEIWQVIVGPFEK